MRPKKILGILLMCISMSLLAAIAVINLVDNMSNYDLSQSIITVRYSTNLLKVSLISWLLLVLGCYLTK